MVKQLPLKSQMGASGEVSLPPHLLVPTQTSLLKISFPLESYLTPDGQGILVLLKLNIYTEDIYVYICKKSINAYSPIQEPH